MRQVWLSDDLSAKLKHKTNMHRQWTQEYMFQRYYRDMGQECRETTKAKEQLEVNVARDVNNNKGFSRCIR